jgi:hypothetical protein
MRSIASIVAGADAGLAGLMPFEIEDAGFVTWTRWLGWGS